MNRFRLIILLLFTSSAFGQTGGTHAWQFLDLDFNARGMALGGDFIPLKDGDLDLAVANPAAIDKSMDQNLALNHFFYPAGINYGQLAFARNFEKLGTFTSHLRYVTYGRFAKTDYTGLDLGTFTAGDYALGVGYGHQLNKYFSIGGNFNMIFSHYDSYTSFGVAADMAVMLHDEESNLSATLLARNIGVQFKGFTKKNHEPIPLEVLVGIAYKFHHAPFRLSIVGTDLTTWDLTYNDPTLVPTIDQLTGDTIPVPTASFITRLAYHTNFAVELIPHESFFIRLGFNFQRRNSLGIVDRMGAGGFSFGVGLKLKKFSFDYGVSIYSSAGVSNALAVTTNFGEWNRSGAKKKNAPPKSEE
ncbi:type IX secretion system protein PorQ [Crocinitomix catalasitica]|nr:type IX secretion system protein PorQ [Crocinitomix catalasitica]